MARVNAAWLQPIATDPRLLVNRTTELEDLVGRFEEFREAQLREGHILITGARGVGKSIFTRAAVDRFEKNHPAQVVGITIDSRGLRYRPFLAKLAQAISSRVRPLAEKLKREDIPHWLDQLSLLSQNSVISRAQTESLTRNYGVESTAGADLLLRLQGKFTWQESRSLGSTTQSTLTVSDDLLHAAIVATLERLAEPDSPWFIVVFFDDLDQAVLSDQVDDPAALFRHVLDLRPCISIVHFRTEALVENVAREAAEKIDLKPLSADTLYELVRRRLEAATETVKQQFPAGTDWSAVHWLAARTGTPLVLLKWVHGLLRSSDWPPPAGWNSPESLSNLVFATDPLNGVDPDLVRRLVEIVDRCDGGRRDRTVQREDLLRGGSELSPVAHSAGLTPDEIDDLIKLGVLLPKHRFQPSLGYRIQPVLDLLRPSAMAAL